MIQNRELTIDDYLAMLRRRAKVILIPALLAPLVGFLISFAFTPKYTSESTILVEGQKVPDTMVQPVATEDLVARINTLIPQVTSQAALRPMLQKIYGSGKSEQSINDIIDGISTGHAFTLEPASTELAPTSMARRRPGQGWSGASFQIELYGSRPRVKRRRSAAV